ncbi:hypothetical protein E2562_004133 [Oryza meyeriana var. granulata]|uniref:Uncharacterized protein n=1 Tax=Oryza meyeriana var. granulata TaxID=110450 RepID=A0A6G1EV35_9ORYZ|nr:hypothetical protein E2562_004133 [Oryza meyeriana var. granulata]
MASDGDISAKIDHLSGADLVRHHRTTSHMADYEAGVRVICERERWPPKSNAYLPAKIDAMWKEHDVLTRAVHEDKE